jgi:hypothetical protein
MNRSISQVIEELARRSGPLVEIDAVYREMAADEARERDALEWSEGLVGDSLASR